MAKILGLDLSTHTGWAVLTDGMLTAYGLIERDEVFATPVNCVNDFLVMAIAENIASKVYKIAIQYSPDEIWIEQTNGSSFRNSQKLLEFIHYAILLMIRGMGWSSKVNYVDTSAWRTSLNIRMGKEDRKNNKQVREGKKRGKITTKHLSVRWANTTYGLKLKLQDNDIADALAVCAYGAKKWSEIHTLEPYSYKFIDEVLK